MSNEINTTLDHLLLDNSVPVHVQRAIIDLYDRLNRVVAGMEAQLKAVQHQLQLLEILKERQDKLETQIRELNPGLAPGNTDYT